MLGRREEEVGGWGEGDGGEGGGERELPFHTKKCSSLRLPSGTHTRRHVRVGLQMAVS